jgi:hypothetical protein
MHLAYYKLQLSDEKGLKDAFPKSDESGYEARRNRGERYAP